MKTPMSKMKINFYLILIFNLILISKVFAQTDSTKKTVVGLSAQIYPAGLIATIHTELFYNKNTSLFFRAGGNFADRKISALLMTMKEEMDLAVLRAIANTLI